MGNHQITEPIPDFFLLNNGVSLNEYYGYRTVSGNRTTSQVNYFENAIGRYSYTYDGNGNITNVVFESKNEAVAPSKNTWYQYDGLDQLTRVHDGYGQYAYYYDNGGNITFKELYYNDGTTEAYVPTGFVYESAEWRDQLTSYGREGDLRYITYDEIGNPKTYGGATLGWSNGRQLTSYSKNGTTIAYQYDGEGKRIAKAINNTVYYYTYNQGTLVGITTNDNSYALGFFYDEKGEYIGFYYGDATYYYIRNPQGDIVGIADANGTVVVVYEYDPFGNLLSIRGSLASTVGVANPIRYRGYFYDTETGFYYLQSRYYDPQTGRFLNADEALNGNGNITSFNIYIYCSNNPIMFSDPSGYGIFDSIQSKLASKWQKFVVFFNVKILKKEPLPYKSVTEAATASGVDLNNLTQSDDLEHGQGIIYDKSTDSYGLTDVIDGDHASVNFSSLLSVEHEGELVAFVHSHPCCTGHNGNEFSDSTNIDGVVSGDWAFCQFVSRDLYLAAPNGILYLMKWDVGEYNQSSITTSLPVDESIFDCNG